MDADNLTAEQVAQLVAQAYQAGYEAGLHAANADTGCSEEWIADYYSRTRGF
jgi:hypothetical protein